jgi:hypothetical protein
LAIVADTVRPLIVRAHPDQHSYAR